MIDINSYVQMYSKPAVLRDGTKVEIIGRVFDRPLFPASEVIVYNSVHVMREGQIIGAAFYQDMMDETELKAKVEEVSEDPHPFLYTGIRAEFKN